MRLLTLKCVLVATDLEDGSGPALRTAARLAHLAGAELHVLHVTGERLAGGVPRLHEHFVRLVPDAPWLASAEVIPGSAASVIVEHAGNLGVDALILGPHRGPGIHEGELGSTAAAVVRGASCPCLVAATELRLPLERVLAPIDFSDASRAALSVAVSWASALRPRDRRAQLTALHVAPDPTAADIPRKLHDYVQWARTLTGDAARVDIRETVVPGVDPAEAILRAAAEPADLLVMGTRAAHQDPSSLGSVSAAVARATPCPLLLVPPVVLEREAVADA